MLLHVICPTCGVDGSILTDDRGSIPVCPRCGVSFQVESAPEGKPPFHIASVDDVVVTWLSQMPPVAAREPDRDLTCSQCGYEGLMRYDSDRGDAICPACLEVFRSKPANVEQWVNCPECGQVIEVREHDRGRTIICPCCKDFLGCLLPHKKRPHLRRS